MDPLFLSFVMGLVLGAAGLGLGFWVRLYLGAPREPKEITVDRPKITFHRPKPGVLVVEVREDLSAAHAAQLREWLEWAEGDGAHVLIVPLGDRQ